MTPKWPEKLDDSAVYFGADAKYYDGYNAARDDCIKAWEDSPKLVELNREKLASALWEAEKGDETPANVRIDLMEECYRRADFIRNKFGIPEGKK